MSPQPCRVAETVMYERAKNGAAERALSATNPPDECLWILVISSVEMRMFYVLMTPLHENSVPAMSGLYTVTQQKFAEVRYYVQSQRDCRQSPARVQPPTCANHYSLERRAASRRHDAEASAFVCSSNACRVSTAKERRANTESDTPSRRRRAQHITRVPRRAVR